jgi:hypothetical protein
VRLLQVIGPDGPSGESHNPLCPPVGGYHQPTPSRPAPYGTLRAQADASHPCDACGGSGYRETDVETFGTPHWGGTAYYPPCPVCQGSGRISDVIPAADAKADAETLRLFMLDGRHFCDLGTCEGYYLGYMDLGAGVKLYLRRGWWKRAVAAAPHAALAAFKAVPGLRGDR